MDSNLDVREFIGQAKSYYVFVKFIEPLRVSLSTILYGFVL